MSKSFRKVFLSIKGIYYQVEIMGQLVTWIVPYKFTQRLPFDIDYSVMNNFLEFYIQLLKFINYKLYSDVSIEYPPTRVDEAVDVPTQFDYELANNQQ